MNNFSVAELEENANICILNLHFLRVQWLAEKKDNNYTNSTRNTGEKEAIFFFWRRKSSGFGGMTQCE